MIQRRLTSLSRLELEKRVDDCVAEGGDIEGEGPAPLSLASMIARGEEGLLWYVWISICGATARVHGKVCHGSQTHQLMNLRGLSSAPQSERGVPASSSHTKRLP